MADNIFPSSTKKVPTGCGNLYCTMDIDSQTGDIKRIFLNLGKSGGCGHSWCGAIGEMLQELIENGATTEKIAARMEGHRCQLSMWKGALSCSDGIAQTLILQHHGLIARETREPFLAWMRELKARKLAR
jgi:hypothetical protein